MAWLLFSRSKGRIELFAGHTVGAFGSAPLGSWAAHNNTDSHSNGQWPLGTYRWSHYNAHTNTNGFGPSCRTMAYGCNGIHVFDVSGRPGIGVHAGRTNYNDVEGTVSTRVTLGCIRVPENAMQTINASHNSDVIAGILVTP